MECIDTSDRLNGSNNDIITVRVYERVVKFQIAGLQEKVEEAGLSVYVFYKAMRNSEV